MTVEAPTGRRKALAITAAIVAALAALLTMMGVVHSAYTVITGEVAGAKGYASLMKIVTRRKSIPEYEQAMEAQIATQRRMAPYQLASQGTYLVATTAIALLALLLVWRGRPRPSFLAAAAGVACACRLAVGVVTYTISEASMKGMERGFERQIAEARGVAPDEAQASLRRLTGAYGVVTRAALTTTLVGQTLLVAGFWGLVAYVFGRARERVSTPP